MRRADVLAVGWAVTFLLASFALSYALVSYTVWRNGGW